MGSSEPEFLQGGLKGAEKETTYTNTQGREEGGR
jgi:hypothetical protein